tara:strand:- start:641 stop:1189 length:549 start_codon:yes stop_codon:yes gene_type:complete
MYDIMVLYILRHEKRDLDKYDFFSPLNMIGKHYSKIFQYSKFNDIDIEEIYSSPYKRALDTVSIISISKKVPIKIDWALTERIYGKNISNIKWPNISEQEDLHSLYEIDNNYTPTADINYINSYDESLDRYITRVDTFSQFIETQKHKNILIVTHQCVTDRLIKNLTGKDISLNMGECYEIA